ncbi:MAG: MBL fold metallo-hydrolase [Erysipelotrichaceae bacterium]|nr:MBL fold metallo-hydrolase [Erysipelotrichaceae bacterium]
MEIKTIPIGPISNFYAITENGKTMLVDAGCYLNRPGWTLKAAMSGIDLSNVSLIVLTHGHFDHAGGIHHAKELTGAPIMAHPGCETFLKTGKFTPYVVRNALGQAFYDNIAGPAPVDAPEPVDIDIPVCEETDLHPYGFSARVIMTPGHTLDAISVVFDSGEAFVGDTILDPFGEGICTFAVLSLDNEALKESGKKLLDAGVKEAYSGHGGPFNREQIEEAYRRLVEENG